MYVLPPNPEWTDDFESESKAILDSCESKLTLHHIGSTAVPGLWAKDCIDLLGVISDWAVTLTIRPNLEALGYVHKGEYGIKDRDYYSKAERKSHLHIYPNGHPLIQKHLNFVQIMRNNPSLRDQLNHLKQKLHALNPDDKAAYQAAKASFYQQFNTTS